VSALRVESFSFTVRTTKRFEVIDVTQQIQNWLSSIKAADGIALISVPHTTASLTVNESEAGLKTDIIDAATSLFNPQVC